MNPLEPGLRRLLRGHRDGRGPVVPPSSSEVERILRRARSEGALGATASGRGGAGSSDTVLGFAFAFACVCIVAGAALFLADFRGAGPQPAWVSASQFAASQFLR